jgi:hypothetical protein
MNLTLSPQQLETRDTKQSKQLSTNKAREKGKIHTQIQNKNGSHLHKQEITYAQLQKCLNILQSR